MCRITGLVGNTLWRTTSEKRAAIERMSAIMAPGGPDDVGTYANEADAVYFGHRRLSLLDPSPAGHQPMGTPDGNLWLAFNGEIYNFLDLRNELIGLGYPFISHTDTEVILWAYHAWGAQAFERFNGMYAFALYDKRKQCLFLVRDASGIKPLYYYIHGQTMVFASEVKAFRASALPLEENPNWKVHYLTFGHMPEPYTTLKGVHMLAKGTYLKWEIQTGEAEINSFSRFTFTASISDKQEAMQLIRQQLTLAVKRQLVADAPIGVFLSGGIDSSLLALLAGESQHADLRTLSVVFEEGSYSERKYQEVVLKRLGGKHTFYTVTPLQFDQSLPCVFAGMDQPSTDGINTWFIARCAREEGLKAVLSGLGADELLGGYPSFNRIKHLDSLKLFPKSSFAASEWLSNDKWKKFAFLGLTHELGKYLFLRGMYTPRTVARILDMTEAEVIRTIQTVPLDKKLQGLSAGEQASWLEMNLYMQNQLLKDTDFMSMRHGVEVRVPFLDEEFIRAVMRVSPELKFDTQMPKGLLIDAFKDLLPEAIWNRPKMGFTFPFKLWLKNNEMATSLLQHPNRTIQKLALAFQQDKLSWSRIWSLAIVNNWKLP